MQVCAEQAEIQDSSSGKDPVRQISVFMQNCVGALHSIVSMLKAQDIEILGLSMQDSVDFTLLRLIVTDAEATKDLLTEHGYHCLLRTVLVVPLDESSPQLPEVLGALLTAEINVHHSYALFVSHKRKPLITLCLDDVETGADALHKTGFTTLSQSDLSR